MWTPPQQTTTLTVTGSDQQQIVSLLQSALRERKFTELRPDYWTREGADVSWDVSTSGEVRLQVGAFGAKREVRESERVELDLVRFLLAQPGIRVIPDTSPRKAPIE